MLSQTGRPHAKGLQSLGVVVHGFRQGDDVVCRYGRKDFVLVMPADGTNGRELLQKADAALCRAKRAGRNRIVVAASPGATD